MFRPGVGAANKVALRPSTALSQGYLKMLLEHNKARFNDWLIGVGVAALVLGVIVYLVDRPPSQVYFVPELLSQYNGGPFVFGLSGYHMPAFLHAFAFSLISVGIINSSFRVAVGVCLIWLFIDGLFELAQHQLIAVQIAGYIPGWFKGIPVLQNTRDYLLYGRFDVADLFAILLGVVCALLIIFLSQLKKQRRDNAKIKNKN
ncbi:MAG: hypothetical protein OEY11_07115 [Gammaproteobacteria bacterium]|nr:hypothetical protein [Gammaproteobacteria bacterium]